MIAGIIAMLFVFALSADFFSSDQAAEDDDSAPDEPDGESDSEVRHIELGLSNAVYNLDSFDPTRDKLIVQTPSLNIDVRLEQEDIGSQLRFTYGDSVIEINGPWNGDELVNSVILRHVISEGTDQGATDYLLQLHSDDPGRMISQPVFVDFGDESFEGHIEDAPGVFNFGDTVDRIVFQGPSVGAAIGIEGRDGIATFDPDTNSILQLGDGDDELVVNGGLIGIVASGGDDNIEVSQGQIQADLGSGNDQLSAEYSVGISDTLIAYGGDGSDSISGSINQDVIDGGRGEDDLFGYFGEDTIMGGSGSDLVMGGSGNDTIIGARGDAFGFTGGLPGWFLYDDHAIDSLVGGDGSDRIIMDSLDYVSGGNGGDIFAVYFDPQANSVGFVGDFDPTEDHVHVVLRVSDSALRDLQWPSSGTGQIGIDGDAEWRSVENGTCLFDLYVGEFHVLQVYSDTIPSGSNVSVSAFVVD